MARIGLRPGDSIQYGDLKLVVISGVPVLSYSSASGDKVWCEELSAGEYCLTIVPRDGKIVGD
jgi:hypothetical protein